MTCHTTILELWDKLINLSYTRFKPALALLFTITCVIYNLQNLSNCLQLYLLSY